MADIKPMACISAAGATIGGLVACVIAGPAAIVEGIKIGFGIGVQAAIINKTEQTINVAGEKISTGVDTAGRKVEQIAEKTGNAIEKIGNVTANAIEKTADIWSKMMLTGYAIQIALNGSHQSMGNYNEFCKLGIDSLQCLSVFTTTLSLNLIVSCMGLGLAYQVYKMSVSDVKKEVIIKKVYIRRDPAKVEVKV